MKLNNPIHQAIYRDVVKPALNKKQETIDGYVIRIDYENQVADVAYYDRSNPVQRIKKNVALPKDADGVFRQAVKNGDKVTISFKNGSLELPYISVVYRGDADTDDYLSPYGGRTIRQSRLL
jgi:hypothetical protein